MTEEIQKKLQDEINNYKQTQKEYQKALTNRQQLDGQLNENTVVNEELNCLKSGNEVYKLIGPVLIKQELVEAKENVKKRMEFITAEMKRTDDVIAVLEKKQENQRANLEKLQQSFQAMQAKQIQKSKS